MVSGITGARAHLSLLRNLHEDWQYALVQRLSPANYLCPENQDPVARKTNLRMLLAGLPEANRHLILYLMEFLRVRRLLTHFFDDQYLWCIR